MQAFSIDDSHTTEIDDALSLARDWAVAAVTLGIHIAAPGLAIAPDSAIDQVARHRLSTVYMPGHKITMLPDDVVQTYTLMAGRDCPAVSLYVTFDEATLAITDSRTALERVPIAHNLRHDQLDAGDHRSLAERRIGAPKPPRPRSLRCSRQLAFLLQTRQTPEGTARGGARQARDLQPPGLQLPPGRRGGQRTRWQRDRA